MALILTNISSSVFCSMYFILGQERNPMDENMETSLGVCQELKLEFLSARVTQDIWPLFKLRGQLTTWTLRLHQEGRKWVLDSVLREHLQ